MYLYFQSQLQELYNFSILPNQIKWHYFYSNLIVFKIYTIFPLTHYSAFFEVNVNHSILCNLSLIELQVKVSVVLWNEDGELITFLLNAQGSK